MLKTMDWPGSINNDIVMEAIPILLLSITQALGTVYKPWLGLCDTDSGEGSSQNGGLQSRMK